MREAMMNKTTKLMPLLRNSICAAPVYRPSQNPPELFTPLDEGVAVVEALIGSPLDEYWQRAEPSTALIAPGSEIPAIGLKLWDPLEAQSILPEDDPASTARFHRIAGLSDPTCTPVLFRLPHNARTPLGSGPRWLWQTCLRR